MAFCYIFGRFGIFCGRFGIFCGQSGIFCGQFGIFFPLWYVVRRKIRQHGNMRMYFQNYKNGPNCINVGVSLPVALVGAKFGHFLAEIFS
jgi:hypothetical protein